LGAATCRESPQIEVIASSMEVIGLARLPRGTRKRLSSVRIAPAGRFRLARASDGRLFTINA